MALAAMERVGEDVKDAERECQPCQWQGWRVGIGVEDRKIPTIPTEEEERPRVSPLAKSFTAKFANGT